MELLEIELGRSNAITN